MQDLNFFDSRRIELEGVMRGTSPLRTAVEIFFVVRSAMTTVIIIFLQPKLLTNLFRLFANSSGPIEGRDGTTCGANTNATYLLSTGIRSNRTMLLHAVMLNSACIFVLDLSRSRRTQQSYILYYTDGNLEA